MTAVGESILMLHFPRTGGTRLGELLENAGLVTRLDGDAHRILLGWHQTPLVVLREPANWLYSYWSFRCRGGRACVPEVDPHIDWAFGSTVEKLSDFALDVLYDRYASTLPGTRTACYERLQASLEAIFATLSLKPVKLGWKPVIREIPGAELIKAKNPLAYQLYEDTA